MIEFFTHPILRGPTIGCMLMSFVSGLIGVFVLLRKQSLAGEALSHATYPGVILGVVGAGALFGSADDHPFIAMGVMVGAFGTAILGFYLINWVQARLHLSSDSALCLILSSFFGFGVLLASHIQFTHTSLYKRALIYLYGQAATMTDVHILLYGILAFAMCFVLFLFYKELKVITLDSAYARSMGIPVGKVDFVFFVLVVLSIVIGIRSVGVVLMSAMLIAPAAAARQWSERLWVVLTLSGAIGLFSGWVGNVISVQIGEVLSSESLDARTGVPTGPVIVLSAVFICLFSLIFSPERGLLTRALRMLRFRLVCQRENILKSFWYFPENTIQSYKQIKENLGIPSFVLRWTLWTLSFYGYLSNQKGCYSLTKEGRTKAAYIVRLHRLWEAYLVTYLGFGAERVHHSAEEMEHIITPELEKELTDLLHNPSKDPHNQPIPPHGGYR